MKKVSISLLLTVAMLLLSVPAYAEDATSGSISVIYEYTAPEPTNPPDPPDPPEDTATYIIEIPATVTNDNMSLIPITASKNTIAEGKMVTVTIDWDKSYNTDGYFYLYKNKGDTTEESIRCRILRYLDDTLAGGNYVDFWEEARGVPLVKFPSGSTAPSYGGFLEIKPLTINAGVSSGTYT